MTRPDCVAFGEKSLVANPNSMPALLMLANTYVEESKPSNWGKAVTYSQKVIALAKENEPDADRTRKLSAGVAHSTLGYSLHEAGQNDRRDSGTQVGIRVAERDRTMWRTRPPSIGWATPMPRSTRLRMLAKS